MKASFGGRRVGNQFAAALVVALALLFVLTSCSSSDPVIVESGDPQVVESDDLVGRWSWVRSTGGIAGTTRTPETEGYEGLLRFGADGTAEWSTDGELQWSTTWVLEVIVAGPMHGNRMVRYRDPVFGWDGQFVYIRMDGRLILTDPCCDGFQHEFVRDERGGLESAMRRWDAAGPEDYTYLVRRTCYCLPESIGPFEVRVFQGSRDVYDPVTHELIDPEFVDLFPSVDGLFEVIDQALRSGADRLEVDYDRETGTPIRIDIDYMEEAADDEIRYESTVPEPLTLLLLSDLPPV